MVAHHLGVLLSSAWIAPVDNPAEDEKTWVGRIQLHLTNRSGTGPLRVSRRKHRMIGVAGAVAELCWKNEIVDPYYWDEPEIMSESDWKATCCAPGEPDRACYRAIDEVADLLARTGPLWPALIREARDLILDLGGYRPPRPYLVHAQAPWMRRYARLVAQAEAAQ